MLDLNELALFVEVVRAGSFAGAGRRLGMPANSVSRRIQALEERLGSRLMQRSTRKLSLTSGGQALYERCAAPVAELAEAGEAAREGGTAVSGLVRVAATVAFFEGFAMEWVAQFMAQYPQVRLEFLLNDARADLIADGIDLAFRGGPLDEAGVVARKLQPVHFGLVASPAYIAARGAPSSLRDLAAHDCLVLSSRTGPVVWRFDVPVRAPEKAPGNGPASRPESDAEKGLEAEGEGRAEVRVTGRFGASIAGAVLQAALQGMGIAYLPSVLSQPEIDAGRLVTVLPQYKRESGGMYAVLPSRRQVPRAVSAFLDFATEKMRAQQAGASAAPQPRAALAPVKRPQKSRAATK